MLPTLTDSAGTAFASLDTALTYKIRVSYGGYRDSVGSISGLFGDTVTVVFDAEGVGIDDDHKPDTPTDTGLRQNYPNPFGPTTAIDFQIIRSEHVHLAIFDVEGRVVRTLLSGCLPAGSYSRKWDGLSDSGAPLADGVYYYRLRCGSRVESKKMVLIR